MIALLLTTIIPHASYQEWKKSRFQGSFLDNWEKQVLQHIKLSSSLFLDLFFLRNTPLSPPFRVKEKTSKTTWDLWEIEDADGADHFRIHLHGESKAIRIYSEAAEGSGSGSAMFGKCSLCS